MTFRSLRLFCGAFAFSALACTARAQRFAPPLGGSPPMATASYIIPQTTDPGTLTFTQEGLLYTNLDGVNAGDQLGGPLLGSVLTTPSPNGPAGVELHGQLTPTTQTPNTKIIDVDIYTTYMGAFSAATFADTFVDPNAIPWNVNRINPLPGFFQGFRFTADDPNSVPIDNNLNPFFNFALFFVEFTQNASQADMAAFNSSAFGAQGFTTIQQTPEPGTCALLGALVVSGGVAWRKRRKQIV